MAGKCNPQSQVKRYAQGGAVSSSSSRPQMRQTEDGRMEPVIGSRSPVRGSTGGGLNDLSGASGAPASSKPPRTSGDRLNPRTMETKPRARQEQEEALGLKKGGLVPARASLPGAARRMGAQFGQGKGESAIKPAGKASPPPIKSKPTKGGFGKGSGPVKQTSANPIRKKFI